MGLRYIQDTWFIHISLLGHLDTAECDTVNNLPEAYCSIILMWEGHGVVLLSFLNSTTIALFNTDSSGDVPVEDLDPEKMEKPKEVDYYLFDLFVDATIFFIKVL